MKFIFSPSLHLGLDQPPAVRATIALSLMLGDLHPDLKKVEYLAFLHRDHGFFAQVPEQCGQKSSGGDSVRSGAGLG
jgi:hypothetical protein